MAQAMTDGSVQTLIDKLTPYGLCADEEVNIADAALLLSALIHPGLICERYKNHIDKLIQDVKSRHSTMMAQGADDCLDSRITALRDVLAQTQGYNGDAQTDNDMQGADLISVIDRRIGSPVALAILYLQVARAQGWEAQGLDIPGAFAVRMDKEGERVICDPATDFRVLQAPDLRRLVKRERGPQAELSATYYEPSSNRAILIRLQNTIKTRQIEVEDYDGALQSVLAMRALDPEEYRLLLDQGVLYARLGTTEAAIQALEQYIERAPRDRHQDRHEAAQLLQQLKEASNQ